ncbi:hypothetical protein MesoLj131a_60780 [Mesorhizobium sp. 131-2-1]|nr:hypothetical protein MesoLj131a_60780 [Mesorhizobium sp. 131-2-1]
MFFGSHDIVPSTVQHLFPVSRQRWHEAKFRLWFVRHVALGRLHTAHPELALDFKTNLAVVLVKNIEINVASWFSDEHREVDIATAAIVVTNGNTALGWAVAVYQRSVWKNRVKSPPDRIR